MRVQENTVHNFREEYAGLKKNGENKDMKRDGHELQDWTKRVRLPPFDNDNAGNCGNKVMSNRDEEKMGSDKNCGIEGKTQMFDMGWMKNG
jgi:hypothetical protein